MRLEAENDRALQLTLPNISPLWLLYTYWAWISETRILTNAYALLLTRISRSVVRCSCQPYHLMRRSGRMEARHSALRNGVKEQQHNTSTWDRSILPAFPKDFDLGTFYWRGVLTSLSGDSIRELYSVPFLTPYFPRTDRDLTLAAWTLATQRSRPCFLALLQHYCSCLCKRNPLCPLTMCGMKL